MKCCENVHDFLNQNQQLIQKLHLQLITVHLHIVDKTLFIIQTLGNWICFNTVRNPSIFYKEKRHNYITTDIYRAL